ncbi:MAG: hypothetical protein FRX49_06470 [Trebouxia sp. A1-2]|nr:MAG: hypothetical protein FRX49_06470 [Trebouxia sp. A1-2]
MLTLLGLRGIKKTAAVKLINGLEIDQASSPPHFTVRYVVSRMQFLQTVEHFAFDQQIEMPRRDGQDGTQTATLTDVGDGLQTVITWGEPNPVTLIENYTEVQQDTLITEAKAQAGGLATDQREAAAHSACSALQAHKAELSQSSHMTELAAGLANIMISLQCQGSLVHWMVAIVLSLWSPDDQASLKQQPDEVASVYTNASDTIRQVTPLHSMMRHVGTAMLQTRTAYPKAAMQMTQLISTATNSGHWQEGMTGVLAAGGLLEGFARGAAAVPVSSPPLQALCHLLTQACSASQAAIDAKQAVHDREADTQSHDALSELEGLFQASALGLSAEQGNIWLRNQCSGRLMQEAATMARIAAELYRLVDSQAQQVCRDLLQKGARELYEGYKAYALNTPLPWMQAIDAAAVRQVLDKAFMSGVLLMTAFCSVAAATEHNRAPADKSLSTNVTTSPAGIALGPATAAGPATTAVGQAATEPGAAVSARPHANGAAADGSMIQQHANRAEQQGSSSSLIAAELLDSMSYLQFCRMKLTAYNTLLKNVLTSVSTSAEATQLLMDKLPHYSDLIATPHAASLHADASQSGSQQAAWSSDTVLATRVMLLMNALGACLPALPQGDAALQAAPMMFLYLQHPQKPVSAAAHSLFCAVLKHSDQKEELIPFYMKRALEAYPSCTHISGLTAGVDAAMRELPSGSPVVLLTLHILVDRASALLFTNDGMKQNPEAALDLIRLLAQMLLVIEFQFLPDALSIVGTVVLGCRSTDVQLSACNCIHEVLMTSDDYTRKVRCVQWYQHLAAACAEVKPVSALAANDFESLSLTKDTNSVP